MTYQADLEEVRQAIGALRVQGCYPEILWQR